MSKTTSHEELVTELSKDPVFLAIYGRDKWLDELRSLLEDIRNSYPDIEDWPAWIAACESGALDRTYHPPRAGSKEHDMKDGAIGGQW